MIVAFVAMQGASVEAAICRHQNPLAHAAALHSADKKIAAQALSEETAGAAVSKKGSAGGGGSTSQPTDMLPPATLAIPAPVAKTASVRPTDSPPLADLSIRPLLQPPLV
jgi:hypothetical protein